MQVSRSQGRQRRDRSQESVILSFRGNRKGQLSSWPFRVWAVTASTTERLWFRYDCLRFDLHQHFGRDQFRDFDHRSHGANVTKELPVGLSDFLPIPSNVGYVDPGA